MMLLSNRLTYCITTFIVLVAIGLVFGPASVMAHQLPAAATDATEDEKTAILAHNADPHDPDNDTQSQNHELVESIVLSSMYLTTTNTITATITFADGVKAIVDDTETDDTVPTTGDDNEARHGTLKKPASVLQNGNILFEIGTEGTDGTYTFNTVGLLPPRVLSVAETTPAGGGTEDADQTTGTGAVYTVVIAVPETVPGGDGVYRVSVEDTHHISDDVKSTFTMDTRNPTVTAVATRPIGQNYANANGEWSTPFEITFNLLDPIYDPNPLVDGYEFASGLDLGTVRFDTDPSDELTFGDVGFISPGMYVVTAIPVEDTEAKNAATVSVTIKVSDNAGNEGKHTDATDVEDLEVKLTARDGTGTGVGPGEMTPPELASLTAPTEPEEDGSLIFEIVFNEELAADTFTTDDLVISNAVSSTLSTEDDTTYELRVVPENKDFPVQVEFKLGATVNDASSNNNPSAALTGDATYTPEGVLGVDITEPTKPEIDGKLKFKFEFASEPRGDGPGAFTVSDITVSNAEDLVASNLQQSVQDPKVYILTVTPMNVSLPVTVQLNGDAVSHFDSGAPDDPESPPDITDDVTLIAGQISATYTPDITAPVVTITPPPADSGNPLTFIIDFNEALSNALTKANLVITGADAATATLTPETTGLPAGTIVRYTLAVTGEPGIAVTVNIMANAVMDAVNNAVVPLATAATFTIPVDPGDTTAPTLVISYSPANGVALPESGNVTFTFIFSEALGLGDDAFTLGDVMITNGNSIDFSGSGTSYKLEVEPIDPNMPVGVAVTGTVKDAAGNALAASSEASYEPLDDTDPTVVITGAAGTGDDVGKIVFTFTFSEELGSDAYAFTIADIDRTNSNVLLSGQPVQDADDPTVYTLVVTPNPSDADPVIIVLRTLSVADPTGNMLKGDQVGTYNKSVDTAKPTVAISASNLDDSGFASTAGDIDSVDGGMITITASDTVGLASGAEVVQGEVTVEYGSMSGSFTKGETASFTVIPNIGATSVRVTVAADAVKDVAGNGNASTSMTFSVGPIFNIPQDTILVITKTMGMTHQYLSDQPRLPINQQPPTPVADIATDIWHNMPDLEVLFSRNGGSNGGTLNVIEAHGQDDINQKKYGDKQQKNSVRISEVMWAVDLSLRGGVNDAEAAEQWIEISNDTGAAVSVFLYARTGLDSAINTDGSALDRVGNAYNGGVGSGGWNIVGEKGQNGNSFTGVDFVSMHRKYTGGDNRGYENGTSAGNWSTSDREYLTAQTGNGNGTLYNYKGSPGRRHSINLPTPNTRAGRTAIPGGSVGNNERVVINEVANHSDARYEWIELRNDGSAVADLRNFRISMVTAVGEDKELINFAHNDSARIPVGGVLLLVATDPRYDDDHPIAVGYNIDKPNADQVAGIGLQVDGSPRAPARYDVVNFRNGGLPDDGKFVLIVRSPDNHENKNEGGKGWAERGEADLDKISDVAGWTDVSLKKTNYPGTNPAGLNNTDLWPLVNFGAPAPDARNSLAVDRVHYRQHVNTNDGRRGTGFTHKDKKDDQIAWRDAGYSGIGYKRTARNLTVNNGTPGYHNNTVNTKANSSVMISEVMYSTGANNQLPQWIELYNSSATKAVHLGSGWRIMIETLDSSGNALTNLLTIHFGSKGSVKYIYPQQTVLVAAGNARQAGSDFQPASVVFPENRLFNVSREYSGDGALKSDGFVNDRYMFFNPKAFHLALLDKDGALVDSIGNLDGDSRTNDTVTPDEEFPSAVSEDGIRTSIIRIYDDGVARTGSNIVPVTVIGEGVRTDHDGIDPKYAWIPAVNTGTEFKITIRSTWYGDEDDYGTPGHRRGLVLPVQLSSFRPTLEDGVVTVRWTTESELDNAGFNIYRSETRDGEYKQVNTELIDGAGTTGERTNYSWVDQTAKPGVVYYYQIEDVSFAGDREALAITKLKGLISAKNKLTTTWSELKEASQ